MTEDLLDQITGVILAGGKSARFGSNKALAIVNGLSIIEQTAHTMDRLFGHHLLITNTPELYKFLNWPMTGDLFPGAGPLAGIHAALSCSKTPHAFIAGCDMPRLNPILIRHLCTLLDDWDVILPQLDNGPEPLHALYSKTALPVISESLVQGERKLQTVLASLKVRTITTQEILAVVPDLGSFANINRQADLKLISNPDHIT